MTEATYNVTLTPRASKEIKKLVADRGLNEDTAGLRIGLKAGGCSGFEYDLSLSGPQEGDEVVEDDGVRVIVDRFSVPYLLGVQLDYEEGFQGAGFLIHNPNASSSCGCGKSFQA